MFRVRLISIILLIVFAFTPNKIFADSYGGYVTCGNYLDNRDDTGYYQSQIAWVMGMISGMNAMEEVNDRGGVLIKIPDYNTIKFTLDKHCKDNPMDNVLDAFFMSILPNL